MTSKFMLTSENNEQLNILLNRKEFSACMEMAKRLGHRDWNIEDNYTFVSTPLNGVVLRIYEDYSTW